MQKHEHYGISMHLDKWRILLHGYWPHLTDAADGVTFGGKVVRQFISSFTESTRPRKDRAGVILNRWGILLQRQNSPQPLRARFAVSLD